MNLVVIAFSNSVYLVCEKMENRLKRFKDCSGLILVFLVICSNLVYAQSTKNAILSTEILESYIDRFVEQDEEINVQYIPNEKAFEFLQSNIPLFECPDKDIERTYYFRWWTFRKHIKETPDGFVVTEFLPDVGWAGKHNTISCAAGHHFYEGRWLHDSRFLNDYARFWFRGGGSPRGYSFWAADALYAFHNVHIQDSLLVDLLPDLIENYEKWIEGWLWRDKWPIGQDQDGLFYIVDDREGMELSISHYGKRPSINSYMYGDAVAISKIAALDNNEEIKNQYAAKAKTLQTLVQEKLWDDEQKFFKTKLTNSAKLVNVRELIGYTPWYFGLPDRNKGYEEAWLEIVNTEGFYAPFGPTTAEQRHPKFMKQHTKGCQWDGPSWPYSTSLTLTALANVLNDYDQEYVTKSDYFDLLSIYANSHKLLKPNGEIVPWIDENLQPFTGDWIMRSINIMWNWSRGYERGKDYNHSTFCDLIITGLMGLRPSADNVLLINPLVPENVWDWFCMDNILYKNHIVCILWDASGKKYNQGAGFRIFIDGKPVAQSQKLETIELQLD